MYESTTPVARFDDYEEPDTFVVEVTARDAAKEPVNLRFRAVKQLSGGAFMQIAMAANEQTLMRAYTRIILEALDDTDGLGLRYAPPADGPSPDEIQEEDRDNPEHGIDPRYWDKDQWSSCRRFADLLDDDKLFLPVKSVEKLSELLMEEAAERPTWKPSRSSRGQGNKNTGSAGPSD